MQRSWQDKFQVVTGESGAVRVVPKRRVGPASKGSDELEEMLRSMYAGHPSVPHRRGAGAGAHPGGDVWTRNTFNETRFFLRTVPAHTSPHR